MQTTTAEGGALLEKLEKLKKQLAAIADAVTWVTDRSADSASTVRVTCGVKAAGLTVIRARNIVTSFGVWSTPSSSGFTVLVHGCVASAGKGCLAYSRLQLLCDFRF